MVVEQVVQSTIPCFDEFRNKTNWDRYIEIDGETYIYWSARNEIRKLVHRPTGDVAVIVAFFSYCFENQYGKMGKVIYVEQ